MKGISSTDALLVHVPGWVGGWMDAWMDGWMGVKAVLRIAYSNQQKQGLDHMFKLSCSGHELFINHIAGVGF
jgi:hypothetical protein